MQPLKDAAFSKCKVIYRIATYLKDANADDSRVDGQHPPHQARRLQGPATQRRHNIIQRSAAQCQQSLCCCQLLSLVSRSAACMVPVPAADPRGVARASRVT